MGQFQARTNLMPNLLAKSVSAKPKSASDRKTTAVDPRFNEHGF